PGVERVDALSISMSRLGNGERTVGVAVFAVEPGSALAPDVGPGRIVLTRKAAEALVVSAGASLELAGRSVTVAAVAGAGEFSRAPVLWAAPGDQPDTGRTAGTVGVLAIHSTEADLAAADQQWGTTTVSVTDSLSAIGSFASENGSLQLMRTLLF